VTALQRQVPGVIGFAPATDAIYLREVQASAGKATGGLVNSLRLLYATLDTDTFFGLDDAGKTTEAQAHILAAANSLRDGGADFLVVTSNSGSIILDEADNGDVLPRESIFDAAMGAARGFHRVGLLSTRRTVDSRRYEEAATRAGLSVLTPELPLVDEISTMIDEEAIRGVQSEAGLNLLRRAVEQLASDGAEAVILGCTDLVLFGSDAIAGGLVPVVDSTTAHARATARRALGSPALR
jgi:aspartate racemase